MPYLHPGEMPRTSLDGSMSVATLKREYTNAHGQKEVDKTLKDKYNIHILQRNVELFEQL